MKALEKQVQSEDPGFCGFLILNKNLNVLWIYGRPPFLRSVCLALCYQSFFAIKTVLFWRQSPGSCLVCSQTSYFFWSRQGSSPGGRGGLVISGQGARTQCLGRFSEWAVLGPLAQAPPPTLLHLSLCPSGRENRLKTCSASLASCWALADLPGVQSHDSSCSAFSSGLVTAPVPALVTLPWLFRSLGWVSQWTVSPRKVELRFLSDVVLRAWHWP